MTRRSRLVLGAAGGTCAWMLVPAAASAHGLVGKSDLPIPRWLFAWAAAIVLVASFVALATLWPKARFQAAPERAVGCYPRWLEPICGTLGVGLLAGVVYAGLAGHQEATANVLPTWIYVVFWIGLPFASFLFGDVFRAFNPWRAVARCAAWLAGLVRRGRAVPAALTYPARLGRWPAVAGLLGFAWLELVYVNKDVPHTLAILALAYAAVQLVGMSAYGIETWTSRADAFAVYFNLFARLSWLRWADGRIYRRPPFVGVTQLEPMAGTAALLATMIGSTSFDGLSVGSVWVGSGNLFGRLQDLFVDLGTGIQTANELAGSVGLAGMILLIAGLYRVGVVGMRSLGGGHGTAELSGRFVHALVPIALAYLVAHYFSLLVYQGQAMGYLMSDPLGDGSNLFGTANASIDYTVVPANTVWYVQVAALIIGHVAGLTLAHDRALAVYQRAREATQSQYWMLAVMVGFTSLGLWILSATQ